MSDLRRYLNISLLSYVLLGSSVLLGSPSAFSLEFFIEPLYWHTTETIDWVWTNSRNIPNQAVTYKTARFHASPGIRVGFSVPEALNGWDSRFFYTKFFSKAKDSAMGNLTSTFFGGKLVQGNDFYYQAGEVKFSINYNMFDWDLAKPFCETDSFQLRPIAGLRAGWIYQTIDTHFLGNTSVFETVKNNFKGIGPKAGVEGKLGIYCTEDYAISLVSDLTASYLYGRWKIQDVAYTSANRTLQINVKNRHLGAFALQGLLGVNFDKECFSMKLSYEISDWFNQYQVFDDGTGAHNNDLVFQGLALRLSYKW